MTLAEFDAMTREEQDAYAKQVGGVFWDADFERARIEMEEKPKGPGYAPAYTASDEDF